MSCYFKVKIKPLKKVTLKTFLENIELPQYILVNKKIQSTKMVLLVHLWVVSIPDIKGLIINFRLFPIGSNLQIYLKG